MPQVLQMDQAIVGDFIAKEIEPFVISADTKIFRSSFSNIFLHQREDIFRISPSRKIVTGEPLL